MLAILIPLIACQIFNVQFFFISGSFSHISQQDIQRTLNLLLIYLKMNLDALAGYLQMTEYY